jgi:hypothetical protein
MKPSRPNVLLCLALLGSIAHASAAWCGSTDTLAGKRTGKLTSQTDSPLVYGATNPATVKFKAKSAGAAAKVILIGQNPDHSAFTATTVFHSDGSAHTDAIVPGVANHAGDGTWTLSSNGRVLSYTLQSTDAVAISILTFAPGAITTHGKIKIAGPSNAFSIKGTATGQSNFGPVTGHYKFK